MNMGNPWQVDSMEAFACLKCPECYFTSKQENLFQDHAVQCHPLSHVLFGMIKLECDANEEKQRYDQKYFENYQYVNSSKHSDVFRDSTDTFLSKIVSDDDQIVASDDDQIVVSDDDQIVVSDDQIVVSDDDQLVVSDDDQIVVSDNDQIVVSDDDQIVVSDDDQLVLDQLKSKETANMLSYSLANSSDVSLIKEEASEEAYFGEQVFNETNESNISNFDQQPLTELIKSRPVVPGGAGGVTVPQNFGRSVNSILTMGGRLCPPKNTGTPKFSDLPTALKSQDNVREYYSHVSQDSEMKTSDNKENDYEETSSSYVKLQNWQFDAMAKELRDGFESWRMIADKSPSNTELVRGERFEKFRKWINKLNPPEGKQLKQFHSRRLLRTRIYNWRKKCKDYQIIISKSEKQLPKWRGSWGILYDLFLIDQKEFEKNQNFDEENDQGENDPQDTSQYLKKKEWPCSICGKSFRLQSNFVTHYVECLSSMRCGICASPFTSTKNLMKHLIMTHEGSIYKGNSFKGNINKENCFMCSSCNSEFFGAKELKLHFLYEHLGGEILPCPVCNATFKDIRILKQHLRFTHGEKTFKCHFCREKYRSKQSLQSHIMSVHENTRPHKCSMCDFAANLKSTLNKHIKAAHEEKKFKCHVCDTKFTIRSSLNYHTKYVCKGKNRTKK